MGINLKKNMLILLVFLSVPFSQDRTTIFYATANDPTQGYDIMSPNLMEDYMDPLQHLSRIACERDDIDEDGKDDGIYRGKVNISPGCY